MARPPRSPSRGATRREFLARTAGLAGAIALPPWLAGCGGGGSGGGGFAPQPNPVGTALVLGAGAAGLQCAAALQRAGVGVTILEASARRHGRVRSTTSVTGVPLELGAEEIRGRFSPLYDMAVRHGAAFATPAPLDRVWTGGIQPTTAFLADDPEFAAAFAFADGVGAYAGPPRSIAQRIADVGLASRTHRYLDGVLGNRYGTSNARLDARALAQADGAWSAGDETFRLRDVSLEDLLDAEFADVLGAVRYSVAIREIDTTGARPVAYTAARSAYTADVIVVTVPLPVLRDGDLEFTPPLPADKQEAIRTIGMDAGVKAVLRFSSRLWAADIGSLYGGRGVAEYVASAAGRGVADDVLTAFAAGDDAEALAAAPSLVPAILDDLGLIYGADDVRDAFAYAQVVDWTEERWIGGAFSYASAGSEDRRAALAAPLGRQVFFAGEATHTGGHFGTLHGALETGLRAAAEVLDVDLVP